VTLQEVEKVGRPDAGDVADLVSIELTTLHPTHDGASGDIHPSSDILRLQELIRLELRVFRVLHGQNLLRSFEKRTTKKGHAIYKNRMPQIEDLGSEFIGLSYLRRGPSPVAPALHKKHWSYSGKTVT
jgi:hypothetical protein